MFPKNFLFFRWLVNWKFCLWKESHIIEAVNNRMTMALILWIRLCFPLTENFLKEGKLGTFRKDLYFILQQLCGGEKSFGNLRLPFLVRGHQNTAMLGSGCRQWLPTHQRLPDPSASFVLLLSHGHQQTFILCQSFIHSRGRLGTGAPTVYLNLLTQINNVPLI